MHGTFAIDTKGVSNLGGAIIAEAQGQLHTDPYNLDAFTSGMNSSVQQLPTSPQTPLQETVQKFVSDFESNYGALLNQRIVIGQILQGKVAPDAEATELQIKDSWQ